MGAESRILITLVSAGHYLFVVVRNASLPVGEIWVCVVKTTTYQNGYIYFIFSKKSPISRKSP